MISPAAAELKVTATIKPVHALVAGVMAGVGTPDLLIKGSASPHSYAMKPSDARAVNASSVFFRVSEALEPFTGKVVKSLPPGIRVVDLAKAPGVVQLDVRQGNTFDAGALGSPHRDHAHEAGSRDGHVWLDPVNAQAMVGEIARVLAEVSPGDAAKLHENAARLAADIGALREEIATGLEPVKGKPFVVFHDAYQYFENRFGLHAAGSITVSPAVQPSARRLTAIRAKISSLGAACVFAEPYFQPRLVEAVIEGTNARSGTLDPEGALVEPGPAAYQVLMRNLAANLKACLVHER